MLVFDNGEFWEITTKEVIELKKRLKRCIISENTQEGFYITHVRGTYSFEYVGELCVPLKGCFVNASQCEDLVEFLNSLKELSSFQVKKIICTFIEESKRGNCGE